MLRSELVTKLCQLHGLRREDAERAVNAALGVIEKALASGRRVELRGLGSFYVVQRKARTGRNPRTAELVKVQAKRFARFRSSQKLRHRIQAD